LSDRQLRDLDIVARVYEQQRSSAARQQQRPSSAPSWRSLLVEGYAEVTTQSPLLPSPWHSSKRSTSRSSAQSPKTERSTPSNYA